MVEASGLWFNSYEIEQCEAELQRLRAEEERVQGDLAHAAEVANAWKAVKAD